MSSLALSPRVLYISPPWPYRSIRSLHVARALQQIGKVEVMIVDSVCGNMGSVKELGTEFKVADELPVRSMAKGGFGKKLQRTLDPRVPQLHGLGVDEEGELRLARRRHDFDLVWVFKLRTANMFRQWNWPGSVLDVDDLPSGVYQTVAQSSPSLKERLQARLQVLQWKRRERLLGERFDVLTVCSEADKRSLSVSAPVHVIPSGFERPPAHVARNPALPSRFGFIGLFDHAPNADGVRWFIKVCWPRIRAKLPDARLRLVGRGSDSAFKECGPGVEGLGWVDDSDAEIASWAGMIVPLHVGGGTRVKIAEGFSRKCPIVATRLGAFGYEVQNGRELFLADSPDDFANACISLVEDPAAAVQMAERAHSSYLEKWTWDAIAPRIWGAAEDCLRRNSAKRAK